MTLPPPARRLSAPLLAAALALSFGCAEEEAVVMPPTTGAEAPIEAAPPNSMEVEDMSNMPL